MKKILSIISGIVFAVLISACTVYQPGDDFDSLVEKLKEKQTVSSFSDLNNPIVIEQPVHYRGFKNSRWQELGNAFLVYDWETESIAQSFFVKSNLESYSKGALLDCYKGSDGNDYYISFYLDTDSVVSVLNATTGKLTEYKSPANHENSFDLINIDNNEFSSAIFNKNWGNELYFFDPVTGKLSDSLQFDYTRTGSLHIESFIPDDSGNYWCSYNDEEKTKIVSVNCASKKINDPIVELEYFKTNGDFYYSCYNLLLYADSEYVIGNVKPDQKSEEIFPAELFVINPKTAEVNRIAIPVFDEDDQCRYVYDVVKIENEFYLIIKDLGNSATVTGNLLKFFKLDLDKKEILQNAVEIEVAQNLSNMCIRGSRAYFVCIDDYEGQITIQNYDFKTNTLTEPFTVIVNDFLSK